MLQGLKIALAQVEAGNTSENLLNEIRQIIYIFCIEKGKLLTKYKTTIVYYSKQLSIL